jgi:predicted Ser/Thr protein kinase
MAELLSAEKLAQSAVNIGLMDESQHQEAFGHFGRRNVAPEEFLQYLLRREYLTNWQADRLAKGEKSGFFYGDYKILYLAGTGTFSRVYRAVHRQTGEMVAVKVLRRRFSEDPDKAEQFAQEGRMGMQLRHPNIVPIYDVYSKKLTHYLVMEFVEGQTLREFLKIRKKLDPAEATRMFIGIGSGLAYAFEKGVTHRDMKLSNVLVSSHGQPKLMDFGLAGVDDKTSIEGADVPNPRTVDYVGLERASGVRKDDLRSDIFFLGCMYYQALTGTPPLQETKDRIQRLSKTRYTEITPILQLEPRLPRSIVAVVSRSMEVAPSLRYQTPGEMLAELQVAYRRLSEGHEPPAAGDPATAGEDQPLAGQTADKLFEHWGASASAAQKVLTPLMVVESNVSMQDTLRTGLKRAGYRVLLTRDPTRPSAQFHQNAATAACVVFSTQELGEEALEAFNRFGQEEHTSRVPAVLLLAEPHADWRAKAQVGEKRIVLMAPIKLREFRKALALLAPPAGATSPTT